MWPATAGEWAAIAGLGLMPVGLAFYAWDHGVKHGNIQMLGGSAYFAPLFSTALLVATGMAPWSNVLLFSCVAITFGAVLASGRLTAGAKICRDRMSIPVALFIAAVLWGIAYGVFVAPRPQSHWRAIAKTVPVALLATSALAADLPVFLIAALALSALRRLVPGL